MNELLLGLPGELYDVRVRAVIWDPIADDSAGEEWQQCGVAAGCRYTPSIDWSITCEHATADTSSAAEPERFELSLQWSNRAVSRWLSSVNNSTAAAAQLEWLVKGILPAAHAAVQPAIGEYLQSAVLPDQQLLATALSLCLAKY